MPKSASVFFVMVLMLALLLPAVAVHAQDTEMARKKCVEFGFKDKTASHESCVKQLLQSTGGGKARSKPAAAPAAPAVSPMQREDKFWDDAKAAGNKEAFEAYLASYPNGAYAGLARANIKRFVEAADASQKPYAAIAKSPEQLIEDPSSGCKVFNNEPQPNENITYVGGCSNGLAQGAGVVTWYKDAKFNEKGDGFWRRGKMNGLGSYEWASGNKYVGDFVDGKKTGKGTFTWASGDKYVGDFVDGKRTGKGAYTWTSGNKYVGDFVDGKRTGKGTFTWTSGDKYVGDFVDGKRTGKGTYTWTSGAKYVGDYVDGKAQGKGVYTFANGTTYVGDFVDDMFNGNGTVTSTNGNKYIGNFVDDKWTGKGTFTWASGDKYVGDFVDGKRTGNGRFTWADGRSYSGGFNDGEFDGEGVYYFANGKEFNEGFWQKGKLIRAYKLK